MKRIKWMLDSNIIFALMAVWLAVYLGPRLYNYSRPPVSGFEVDEIVRDGSDLYVSGVMIKNRCRFAGLEVTGLHVDGSRYHIPVAFLDTTTDHMRNRPTGNQHWGPWRLTADNMQSFSITAHHWCTAFDLPLKWTETGTTTKLIVNFPVPKDLP